jgi:hypothetical protein
MAIPMLGVAGIMAGANLLGDLYAQGRQKDDYKRQWSRPLRKRWNEFGPGIMEGINAQKEALTGLPRMTAGLRSRAASEMQLRMNRLNQSLAMQGRTAGSDIYERQQRAALESLNDQRTGIESRATQMKSALGQQLAQSNMAAGAFRRPTGGPEQTYINPMNIASNALSSAMMIDYLGGKGGSGSGGGVPTYLNPVTAAYSGSGTGSYIPSQFMQNTIGTPFWMG